MRDSIYRALFGLHVLLLGGCASTYSPDVYSSNAVQLANKVEAGVVIGFREVAISTSGNIGTVTGGAAGGVLGVEYANSALVAVAATAVGSVLGNALDHAAGDTTGWEYIVRKGSGDMLSVTQREKKPLALGQKVLVIMGPQARVVPDYSLAPEPTTVSRPPEERKPEAPLKVEVILSLPPGVSVQAAPEARSVQAEEGFFTPPRREAATLPTVTDFLVTSFMEDFVMEGVGLAPTPVTHDVSAEAAPAYDADAVAN